MSYSEKTCKASVLASVMIVAVLMLLVVSGLILVREHYDSAFYRLQEQKQQQMWLDSGFLFYCRDTVVVREGAELEYPSGIYLLSANPQRRVEIKEHAWVNGYVIVDGERRITQKREINYRQALTARVRGLVYVDGIAQVQGIIAGALYVKDSYYFSESGYYSGLLYNAVLLENPEMIWPFWLEGCPERRVIRWLE